MAGALQESKRCVPEQRPEGRAAGKQRKPCRSARAWNAEARARPNVEVNRRAEGTSELNRRLGAGAKGAGALELCGVAEDCGRSCAGKQARCARVRTQKAKQQASNLAAPPEHAEVEQQEPERGLTLRLTGWRGFIAPVRVE